MGLEGTLETFGISEIFQLVSQQGKTGTLEIQTSDGAARIRFLQGKLIEAWPDKRSPSELIGARLVRADLITPTQLNQALERQAQELRPLGDVLIRLGAVSAAQFQEALALQHRETVYRLLRLKRGSFQFLPEAVEFEEGVSSPMDVGALLMEGFRQIDEWPKLLERIPSEQHVYERVIDEIPEDLSQTEAEMLRRCNGLATVKELVDRSLLGEFAGREVLALLYDGGLISAIEAPKPDPKPFFRSKQQARLVDSLLAAVLVLLASVLVLTQLSGASGPFGRLTEAWREARAEAEVVQRRAAAWNASGPPTWPLPAGGPRASLLP